MDYNTVKIKSNSWENGELQAKFYVSTELVAKIIELIGLNENTDHVIEKLPDPPRDEAGHFIKKNHSS